MKDSNKNFDEEWRKAFEDAEEEPSAILWQSIESKLTEKELSIYKQKYFYLRVAASILLFLLSISSFFLIYKNNTERMAEKNQALNSSSENIVTLNNSTVLNQNPENIVSNKPSASSGNKIAKTEEKTTSPSSSVANTNIGNSYNIENQKKEFALTPGKNRSTTQNKNSIKSKSQATEHLENLQLAKASEKIPDELKREEEISSTTKTVAVANDGAHTNNRQWEQQDPENTNSFVGTRNSSAILPINAIGSDLLSCELKKTWIRPRNKLDELLALENDQKKEKKKIKRWYAGYDFTPTYTNQNFASTRQNTASLSSAEPAFLSRNRKSTQDSYNLQATSKEMEKSMKPEFSYNSGIKGGYIISKRLKIESGINYVYTQSKVLTNYYVQDKASNNQFPALNNLLKENTNTESTINSYADPYRDVVQNAYSSSLITKNSQNLNQSYKTAHIYTQYIGVPLTINYQLIDRKINVYIGGGVSADIFLEYGSKRNNEFDKETINTGEKSSFKPIGFSLLFAPELEYQWSSRYSFYLRPVYKGALSSYTDTQKISNKPNSTGVGFGLRYNLN